MKHTLSAAVISGLLLTPAASAADLEVSVEIPQMSVAEYHRPYVAIWLERPDLSFVSNLAVWYQLDNAPSGEKGSTWLKDLRAWWRRSGRTLTMPVDGVSGATKPPGVHKVTFKGASPALSSLAPGQYQLVVEMSREVGGRELLRIPFDWPNQKSAAGAKGEHEIGAVRLSTRP